MVAKKDFTLPFILILSNKYQVSATRHTGKGEIQIETLTSKRAYLTNSIKVPHLMGLNTVSRYIRSSDLRDFALRKLTICNQPALTRSSVTITPAVMLIRTLQG